MSTGRKERVFANRKSNRVCTSQGSLTCQQVVQVAVVEAVVQEAGELERGGLSLTQTNKAWVYILWVIHAKMWTPVWLTDTRQLLVRTVVWRSNSKLSTWVLSAEVWWAWIDSLVAETSWKRRTTQLIIHRLIYDSKSHFALAWSMCCISFHSIKGKQHNRSFLKASHKILGEASGIRSCLATRRVNKWFLACCWNESLSCLVGSLRDPFEWTDNLWRVIILWILYSVTFKEWQ